LGFKCQEFNLKGKQERENKQLARQQQIQLYLEKEKRPITINGVEYKYNNLPEPNIEDIEPLNDEVNRVKFEFEQENNNYKTLSANIKAIDEEIQRTKNDFEEQKNYESKLKINKEFSENQLNKLETEIKRYDQKINDNNKLINQLKNYDPERQSKKRELIQQNEEYRRKIDEIVPEGEAVFLNIYETDKNIVKNNDLLKDMKKQFNELKDLKKKLMRDFKITEVEINNKKAELEQATNELTDAKKENKKLIDEYSSELKRVNFGSFNINKIGNETDEEYFKRISTNAQIPFDNSTTKTLSDIERNKQFKENLKSLFQNEAYIEQILNHFKTTNDHFIFIFNRHSWTKLLHSKRF
jgi:chromosome segregation ATPase